MDTKKSTRLLPIILAMIVLVLACSIPGQNQIPATTAPPAPPIVITVVVEATQAPAEILPPTETPNPPTAEPPIEPTATISHLSTPAPITKNGVIIYDVTSKDTGPEGRAPYGDSYDINRLERPFDQGMVYNPDLDIVTFNLLEDKEWYYVSIELVGFDPNNTIGIQYGLELDLDRDGFGDYVIIGKPPFTPAWSADTVQVYKDENHNTGGLSGAKSDAPFPGDGYEKLIFDGGIGDDPDLAFVRINAGRRATVQFAFKKSLSGDKFMMGVIADAGFRDVGMLDYVDRFTRAEAGSPVRDIKDFPLKKLFNVDNSCREAFGFIAGGFEPQLCPRDEPTPKPGIPDEACQPPPYCSGNFYDWDPVNCICIVTPW